MLAIGAFALALLAGCAGGAPAAPAGSCTLGLAPGASDEEAITALIRAEGELVVAQRIDELMALWAEGASITNAKNTPEDPGDDQYWRDKDAIRHRYVRTVFPGAPAQATPADLAITFAGDTAVITATTRIGGEVSPAGDRWTVVRRGGCWLLDNLTYNLEAQ
jgi:hypothetical protein